MRLCTCQWLLLLIQFYLLEGLVRATSAHGPEQWLALGETLLALLVFTTAICYLRNMRGWRNATGFSLSSEMRLRPSDLAR